MCENIGVVSSVVADYDRAPARVQLVQILGEPGGGSNNDHAVHAIGAWPKWATEPGGAELQGAIERVGQLLLSGYVAVFCIRNKFFKFKSGLRVGVNL